MNIVDDISKVQVGDRVIFSENNFYSVIYDVYTVLDTKKLSNGHQIALIVNDYFRGWFNCNRLMVVVRYCNNVHKVEFPSTWFDVSKDDIRDLYDPFSYEAEENIKRGFIKDLNDYIGR